MGISCVLGKYRNSSGFLMLIHALNLLMVRSSLLWDGGSASRPEPSGGVDSVFSYWSDLLFLVGSLVHVSLLSFTVMATC